MAEITVKLNVQRVERNEMDRLGRDFEWSVQLGGFSFLDNRRTGMETKVVLGLVPDDLDRARLFQMGETVRMTLELPDGWEVD